GAPEAVRVDLGEVVPLVRIPDVLRDELIGGLAGSDDLLWPGGLLEEDHELFAAAPVAADLDGPIALLRLGGYRRRHLRGRQRKLGDDRGGRSGLPDCHE